MFPRPGGEEEFSAATEPRVADDDLSSRPGEPQVGRDWTWFFSVPAAVTAAGLVAFGLLFRETQRPSSADREVAAAC